MYGVTVLFLVACELVCVYFGECSVSGVKCLLWLCVGVRRGNHWGVSFTGGCASDWCV